MKVLKAKYSLGADALQVLCRDHSDDVVQAWGAACYGAFRSSKSRKRLWGQKGWYGWPSGDQFGRGCGAVTPDGSIYHASASYDGGTTGAMVKVGALP